jgi:hypothetical protein
MRRRYPIITYASRDPDWDTDQDGMPNSWETWYGSNPSTFDPNGDRDGDGYMDLEEYLVWIYDPNGIHHPGDVTGDNAVALGDLGIIAGNWGLTGKTWHQGDFTGDGAVGLADVGILAANWGWSGAPPSPAPVPEPGTLAILAAGMFWAASRRSGLKKQ